MLIIRRLGAYVCDCVIMWITTVVCLTIFIFFYTRKGLLNAIELNPDLLAHKALFTKEIQNFFPQSLALYSAAFFLIASFIYFPILESSKRQATFGKRLFKLKVSTEQGSHVSTLHAYQRYFWFALPDILYLLLCVLKTDLTLETQFNIRMFAILLMRVVWYFPIFVTPGKRCAYDILSRTKVINQ